MPSSVFQAVQTHYGDHYRRLHTVSMMNTISHQIETQILHHHLPVELIVGFQRFSAFVPQAARYQALAAVCSRIVVLGIADVQPPAIDGVEFVEIDLDSPLRDEWFLYVNSPQFWTLLSARQTEDVDPISGQRGYDGVWTFDELAVERASMTLASLLGGMYSPVFRRDHETQAFHIAQMNDAMLGSFEATRITNMRRWRHFQTINRITRAVTTRPQFMDVLNETATILREVDNFRQVGVALYTGDQYEIVLAHGLSQPCGTPIPLRGSALGLALSSGEWVALNGDPLLPNARRILAVPLRGADGVRGALVVGCKTAGEWLADDVEMLTQIAELLVTAMDSQARPMIEQTPVNAEELESLRSSVAYLLALHQRLGNEGTLNSTQRETMEQIVKLSFDLARAVGIREALAARILQTMPM
jgi:DICT domain-containing protein